MSSQMIRMLDDLVLESLFTCILSLAPSLLIFNAVHVMCGKDPFMENVWFAIVNMLTIRLVWAHYRMRHCNNQKMCWFVISPACSRFVTYFDAPVSYAYAD